MHIDIQIGECNVLCVWLVMLTHTYNTNTHNTWRISEQHVKKTDEATFGAFIHLIVINHSEEPYIRHGQRKVSQEWHTTSVWKSKKSSGENKSVPVRAHSRVLSRRNDKHIRPWKRQVYLASSPNQLQLNRYLRMRSCVQHLFAHCTCALHCVHTYSVCT